MTGDRFAHTLAETEAWLEDVRQAGGFAHERQAYAALRAVLHTLRDHVAVADTARFAAQLPTLVRGLYFDAWHPDQRVDTMSHRAFLNAVQDRLSGQPDVAAEPALHAVLAVVTARLGRKSMEDLHPPLPKDLLRE